MIFSLIRSFTATALKDEQERVPQLCNNDCFNRLTTKISFISTGNIFQHTTIITACDADCRLNSRVTNLSAAGPSAGNVSL